MNRSLRLSYLFVVLFLIATATSYADDKADLVSMLHAFLAGVDREEVHDSFWAEDLVYTSSSGSRTTKAEIMAGFDGTDISDGPGPVYSAVDVQVNVYGQSAVVAFRLVAKNTDATLQEYLNTGTFLKRDDRWQVVAWQATQIPDE